MDPRRRPLQIPQRLAVATLALVGASCSQPVPPDVVDVADTATTDTAADVSDDVCMPNPGGPGYECIPDFRAGVVASCSSVRTCDPQACAPGCVSCYAGPFSPAGYNCLPDPHADVAAACPSQRVCTLSDCPTGCTACAEAVGCAPIASLDGGPATCTPSVVCNASDCPLGCQPLA